MNVLFVFAHPDDEAFGPYGTMGVLAKQYSVTALCLCNGERPGSTGVASNRIRTFENNCKSLGVEYSVGSHSDLNLDYNDTVLAIEQAVNNIQPTAVYTHNISDINRDHRIAAEATMVACRPKPKSTVDSLYYYEIPASTDWAFGKIEPVFQPNVYQELSGTLSAKVAALSLYATETYSVPDARSVDAMVTLARYRGQQVGVGYAEAFQLVFDRRRRNP